MKKINTKTQMEAYRRMRSANRDLDWERDMTARGYRPSKLEEAKAAYEEAKAAYNATLEPITAAIRAAEGRATARTITADKLISALADVEDRLGISKKAMQGIKVHADLNAQKLPNAYKYRAESTHFTAEYKSGAWVITDIFRADLWQRATEIEIIHTDASRQALLDRFTRFSI